MAPELRPLLLGMGWFPDQAGGLNRHLASLLAGLRSAGTDASAVVIGPAHNPPRAVEVVASPDGALHTRLRAFAAAARRAGRNADLVDAHFALYALVPLLGALRRLPLVVHFHGPWSAEGVASGDRSGLRRRGKHAVEWLVYRRADELIVLSNAFRRMLVEDYGVPPWHIHVVPPGVDLVHFAPGDREAARRRLDVPAAAFTTVAVRRLVPRMGLDLLVEAWREVVAARPGAVLLVAGDGPARTDLLRRAEELGLEENVRFLGRVSEQELADCYRAADVCVVPSVALEGFGLVVLEALACGTPVIATSVGGLPETVASLQEDLVVPAGNSSSLAARLRGAANGSAPLPLAERCRSHAERFDWRETATRTRAVYTRAVAPARRSGIRVVYLDHCARLSGAELALLRLLPALAAVEPHVILAEDGPLADRLFRAGISVEVLPLCARARNLPRDSVHPSLPLLGVAGRTAAYTARLAARLRRLRPDLVHTNSLKAGLYGMVAARAARVPVVFHLRDRLADDYMDPRAAQLVRSLVRVLPSAVIANSSSSLETLGSTRAPRFVIPSPVSIDTHRRNGNRTHAPLRFGVVGRLAPWKGQHVFLDAFARAFPDGDERGLVVGAPLFGEEEYERGLHEQCDSLGLEARVEFTGFREDVGAELLDLDILAHASIVPEPFGQVVVEGMAAGVTVVAADSGAPREIVRHGENGLLYRTGDPCALAAALRELADDPGLRDRLGRAGIETASAYTPDAVAGQVLACYRSVLARRS